MILQTFDFFSWKQVELIYYLSNFLTDRMLVFYHVLYFFINLQTYKISRYPIWFKKVIDFSRSNALMIYCLIVGLYDRIFHFLKTLSVRLYLCIWMNFDDQICLPFLIRLLLLFRGWINQSIQDEFWRQR